MTLGHALLTFAAMFLQVFLLGFQSRSVNSGQYIWSGLCSASIAAAQVVVWRTVATFDPSTTLPLYMVAGPSAIMSAMFVHRRFFKPKG